MTGTKISKIQCYLWGVSYLNNLRVPKVFLLSRMPEPLPSMIHFIGLDIVSSCSSSFWGKKHVLLLYCKWINVVTFFLGGKGRDFNIQRLKVGSDGCSTERLEGFQRQILPPSHFFFCLALSIVMTQALCAWQGWKKNSLYLVPNKNRESLAECQIQVFLIDFEWSSLLGVLINKSFIITARTLIWVKHADCDKTINRHIHLSQ